MKAVTRFYGLANLGRGSTHNGDIYLRDIWYSMYHRVSQMPTLVARQRRMDGSMADLWMGRQTDRQTFKLLTGIHTSMLAPRLLVLTRLNVIMRCTISSASSSLPRLYNQRGDSDNKLQPKTVSICLSVQPVHDCQYVIARQCSKHNIPIKSRQLYKRVL